MKKVTAKKIRTLSFLKEKNITIFPWGTKKDDGKWPIKIIFRRKRVKTVPKEESDNEGDDERHLFFTLSMGNLLL